MRHKKKKKLNINRSVILIAFFLLLFSILIHRIFMLQIVHGQQYADNFSMQTTKTRSLKGTRGNIYDCKGELLAYNQLSYSITLEDNGTYNTTRERNLSLNGDIYHMIQIIEEHGDSLEKNFHILLDQTDRYVFDVEGVSLSRFKADVYGYSKIDDLKPEEAAATPQKMIDDLSERFGITVTKKPYTEEELLQAGLPLELTKEDTLKIIMVRYALFTTSFRKYMQVTIATDVSEETVASILENQDQIQGVDIVEDSIRVYNDSVYFASLLGYTGKISSEELTDLQTQYPDAGYSTTSIVGKAGLEKELEAVLQGKEGYEKVYVDNLGKVLEIDQSARKDPTQGNDIYLTIDKELQIACYQILEQKIAGILVQNIKDIKTFEMGEGIDGSTIPIPIYDVYYALINNSILDITHFSAPDATDTEKRVQAAFEQKRAQVFDQIRNELTGTSPVSYAELSKEMQNYISYIVNDLLMSKTNILSSTAIDRNDSVYKAWTQEEVISLQEYLTYAVSQNWIDISKFSDQTTYLDARDAYLDLSTYIADYLKDDTDFSKMLYKYILLDDVISGRDLCEILYSQGVLDSSDEQYALFISGELSAKDLIISKISKLEITPAQLALDPCSGSIVLVNPSTGETLACVSYPSYDNNRLANTMDTKYYQTLNKDLSRPFYNKATQERTAPGSTFKLITTAAGLSEGVIDDSSEIDCTGIFEKLEGEPLECSNRSGHHLLHIRDAIKNSCNVFFSETAYRLGLNDSDEFSNNASLQTLTKYAKLFHMDEKSGLEIPEATPQISDQYPIPSSIGQGTHNYTTSQLARYATVLASSGNCYSISLLDKRTDADGTLLEDYVPETLGKVELSQYIWDDIHEGMKEVITNDSNKYIFGDLDITLAGKTGTAQESKSRPNHGLFIGYAPADEPVVAMAIRIANGYTSANAALTAKDVLNYYFGLIDETEILTGKATGASTSNTQTD